MFDTDVSANMTYEISKKSHNVGPEEGAGEDRAIAVRLRDYTAPSFLVLSVELDFNLDAARTIVTARTEVVRRKGAPLDAPLVLDGECIDLISIALNDEMLTDERVRVSSTSLTLFDCPDSFTLETVTSCAPDSNTGLQGLYLSGDVLCTQCEPQGFRRITYFPDRPDVMAIFRVRITADKELYPVLLSNGNPVEAGSLDNGKHWVKWEDPYPKPSYLFALVAGNLARLEERFVTQSGRTVAIHAYADHEHKDKLAYALETVKRAMVWDEEVYGREYDLDLFQIAAVNRFNYGAMENKGLNIYRASRLLANPELTTDAEYQDLEQIVAHEYFHNWSGNRVTCRDWFQLCLKEGFTKFRDQHFRECVRKTAAERIRQVGKLRERQFPEDEGPLAHNVRPSSYIAIENFYTGTVYEKGAELIRMLRMLLGSEAYHAATNLYFNRHDGEAATIEQFIACMEEASGRDLSLFFRWYEQAGTPEVHLEESYDPDTMRLTLTFTQRTRPTPGQPKKEPLHMPVSLGLISEDGALLDETMVELVEERQVATFEKIPTRPLVSAFRDFSAPVIVKRKWTLDDRFSLMQHDNNLFNRHEVARGLITDIMLTWAGEPRLDDPEAALTRYAELIDAALKIDMDQSFIGAILQLPTVLDLAREATVIDPDAIANALARACGGLAAMLHYRLYAVYHQLTTDAPFSPDFQSAGRRSMRNATLALLVAGADKRAGALALEHFRTANNMTDVAAALKALAASESAERTEALDRYYARWKGNDLAIFRWLEWQALTPGNLALETVKSISFHEAFDFSHPSKVQALIGGYAANNLQGFHRADGEGYAFFADVVLRVDKINPIIAARLMHNVSQWRRFDEGRGSHIQQMLARILSSAGISQGLQEMANKLLDNG